MFYTVDNPTKNWKGGVGYISKDTALKGLPSPSDDALILVSGSRCFASQIQRFNSLWTLITSLCLFRYADPLEWWNMYLVKRLKTIHKERYGKCMLGFSIGGEKWIKKKKIVPVLIYLLTVLLQLSGILKDLGYTEQMVYKFWWMEGHYRSSRDILCFFSQNFV